MKRLHRLALTSLTALAVLVPAPAMAGTYTSPDNTGDVWKSVDTPHSWNEEVDPTHSDGDISSSTVTYTGRTVTVTVQHAALSAPAGDDALFEYVLLRTNRGTHEFGVVFQSDAPNGQVIFGGRKRCRSARPAVDYAAGTITLTASRRCLKFPRWVRMGAQTSSFSGDDTNSTSYSDDALSSDADQSPSYPTLGPKVHRN
jgi:hypothetical protein